MVRLLLIAGAIISMVSCGVSQRLLALVVDGRTRKPIAAVGVRWEGSGSFNSADENGFFYYHSYGGGQAISFSFEKEGYKSTTLQHRGRKIRVIKLDSVNANPTAEIQLSEKEALGWVFFGDPNFNPYTASTISEHDFDILVDSCIGILQTKPFLKISDEEHYKIMKCLNTVYHRINRSARVRLMKVVDEKHYTEYLDEYYRAPFDIFKTAGFFYPKLKMQLYGGRKIRYAYYKIIKQG